MPFTSFLALPARRLVAALLAGLLVAGALAPGAFAAAQGASASHAVSKTQISARSQPSEPWCLGELSRMFLDGPLVSSVCPERHYLTPFSGDSLGFCRRMSRDRATRMSPQSGRCRMR